MTNSNLNELLKSCIHCGMCLSSCPTYIVTGNEGNSPRGRLYIMNDLQSQEAIDPQAIEYLDNCLSCAACETACPSGVQYLEILEDVRKTKGANNYNKGIGAWIRKIFWKYFINDRNKLLILKQILQKSSWILIPFSLFSKKIKSFHRLSLSLKHQYKRIKTNQYYYSKHPEAQTISLALGCVMDTLYNHVHWDTISVLNHCGYNVFIPESNCCGALAYHSGEFTTGETQLNQSIKILKQRKYPVVINSAGCSAYMKANQKDELTILELIEAIDQAPYPLKNLSLSPNLQATYHPACHLNHQQGLSQNYEKLLKSIQGLDLIPLDNASLCCGSAGFYNIIKPEIANQIGELKAEAIKGTGVKLIITANPGCISQIQGQLGSEYQIIHPIQLIKNVIENQNYL